MRKKYTPSYLSTTLEDIFKKYKVKLAYLFGSHYKGKLGKLSDLDIAILWENDNSSIMELLRLQQEIISRLSYEEVEVVRIDPDELSFSYNIISTGICIFGKEEDRVRFEVRILNEYLDFKYLAEVYNKAFSEHILKKW